MKKYDNFITVPFSFENIDLYFIRTAILNALNNNLEQFRGDLLDVGCGKMPYKKYILENSNVRTYVGLDIDAAIKYDAEVTPDFVWDGKSMPFANGTYDTVLVTEVLEHCPDPTVVLNEIYRVLKDDGTIFITVPFLWNLHEVPHDEYRYTPFALQRILENCGYKNISVKATGGWHASLAQMLGLWLKRSGVRPSISRALSLFFKPAIKYLLKKDRKPVNFHEGLMIPSLYATAKK